MAVLMNFFYACQKYLSLLEDLRPIPLVTIGHMTRYLFLIGPDTTKNDDISVVV